MIRLLRKQSIISAGNLRPLHQILIPILKVLSYTHILSVYDIHTHTSPVYHLSFLALIRKYLNGFIHISQVKTIVNRLFREIKDYNTRGGQ